MKKISLMAFTSIVVFIIFFVDIQNASAASASGPLRKKDIADLNPIDLDALSTAQKISKINKIINDKKFGWEAGETSMSSLPKSARSSRLSSARPKSGAKSAGRPLSPLLNTYIPGQLDWRNNAGDWVTPVRDQLGCGGCWAFSALAVIEARINIELNDSNYNPDLSEQDVISCNGLGNCNGGLETYALDYAKSNGVVRESCFPYQGGDGICSDKCPDWQNQTSKILDYSMFSGPSAIKQAISQYGPVTAYMAVYDDFYFYNHGVYKWAWGYFEGYHSIAVVGYNDAGKYWICKNSWGTGWGENGYFRIDYSEDVLDFSSWNPSLLGEFFLDDSYAVTSTDLDGDGIDDASDKCPSTAGVPEYQGCPDIYPPNITIVFPENNSIHDSDTILVDAYANDSGRPAKTIKSFVDFSNVPANECNNCTRLTFNLTNLTEGNHSLGVFASDFFNNTANARALFAVDVPPEIISQSPANGSHVYDHDNVSFSVTYSEDSLGVVELFWNDTWPYACDNESVCPPVSLTGCFSGKNTTCTAMLNLMPYTGGSGLSYFFSVSDSHGKNATSQPYTITVDDCIPDWVCNSYDVCQEGDIAFCDAINDTNACYQKTNSSGDLFGGSLTSFNLSCKYVPYVRSNIPFNVASGQNLSVDSINETNTSLEIFSASDLGNSVMNIVKYSANPQNGGVQGLSSLDKFIEIGFGNASINLSWALIKIYYAQEEVDSNHINESMLRMYYWNTSAGEWQLVPDSGVNTDDNYVWANVTHFSLYGPYGEQVPYCGDGSCDGGESCSSCFIDCGACPPAGGGGGATSSNALYIPPCAEKWSCTGWSVCAGGSQTRMCTDLNRCGTTKNKTAASRACEIPKKAAEPEIRICIPGEKKCSATDILVCNLTANAWAYSQTCEFGCSKGKCLDKPKSPISQTGQITGTAGDLLAGLMISVAVVALGFVLRNKQKRDAKGRERTRSRTKKS